MMRRGRWLRCRGLLAPSRSTLLLFGKSRETEMHRVSRQRPWWESAAIFVGLLLFMNAMSVVYYVGNRLYQARRPSGNDIYVKNAINAKLFSRPDLAVTAVQMTMHHVLAGSTRPFGAPMTAPESCRAEAEELADFVLELHAEQPAFSVPDLWALLSTRALARIGGPHETPSRGRAMPLCCTEVARQDAHATSAVPPTRSEDILAFAPSPVVETRRDVLTLKRVLASQGFTAGQAVAIMGCVRGIGFHAGADYHTRDELKPSMPNAASSGALAVDRRRDVDAVWRKCTPDPFVFGSTYFDLLLDYNWTETMVTSRWTGRTRGGEVYRCSESDRRRHVTLLDPFSERLEEMRRPSQTDASASASTAGERAVVKRGDTGRSGEAAAMRWSPLPLSDLQRSDLDRADGGIVGMDESDDYVTVNSPEHTDPCPMIAMQGVDVALLDDALTRGWVHRYSADELEFYSAVGDVMTEIQRRGYDSTKLYPWT